jgi:DNA-binding transcriptional regulator GbsR (MarR family)
MKPMRQAEQDFLKELNKSKFSDRSEIVDTEISIEANKLADKQKPHFAKKLGIDKLLKKVEIASKKYHDFKQTMEATENQLHRASEDVADELARKLNHFNKARKWDTSFCGFKTKEDTVAYFTSKLDEVCYEEAKKHIQKNHAVYNQLQAMEETGALIIHTGADIKSVVKALSDQMNKAGIKLPIPEQLLQIAVN